jgi:uncharacterized protein
MDVHDKFRLDHKGASSFAKTVEGIRLLRSHADASFLFSGTLTVINPQYEPAYIYEFLKSLGSPKLDFLYKDGNHTRFPLGKASFESTEFGDWLCSLWNIYVADPAPVPIRILDDIAKLILGARNQKEGLGVSDFSIAIVDTDGSIAKNDTLKNSFDGADSFATKWNVLEDRLATIADTHEYRQYVSLQNPTSKICKSCKHLRVCGGGMSLYRWNQENGYDNPSVYCSDHQRLIGHVERSLRDHLLLA